MASPEPRGENRLCSKCGQWAWGRDPLRCRWGVSLQRMDKLPGTLPDTRVKAPGVCALSGLSSAGEWALGHPPAGLRQAREQRGQRRPQSNTAAGAVGEPHDRAGPLLRMSRRGRGTGPPLAAAGGSKGHCEVDTRRVLQQRWRILEEGNAPASTVNLLLESPQSPKCVLTSL